MNKEFLFNYQAARDKTIEDYYRLNIIPKQYNFQSRGLKERMIITAIAENRPLVIDYNYQSADGLNGVRNVKPAAYGTYIHNGDLILRAFYYGGVSYSKRVLGWRLFYLKGMQNVFILQNKFSAPLPLYRRNDKDMGRIIAQYGDSFPNRDGI